MLFRKNNFTLQGKHKNNYMIRFKILCGLLFSGCLYYFLFQPVITMVSTFDNTQKIDVQSLSQKYTLPFASVIKPKQFSIFGEKIGENKKEPGEIFVTKNYEQTQSILFAPTAGKAFAEKNNLSNKFLLLNGIAGFLGFIAFIAIFYLFIKVINSFRKSEIFDTKNISRINWIGICLILCGLIQNLLSYLNTVLAKSIIEVDGYTVCMPKLEWGIVIFGLSVLLMNEILRQATAIKEEQDLTI